MADKKPEGPAFNPMNDLWLFIFFLVALGVVWFVTGGPSKGNLSNPFLNRPIEERTATLKTSTDEALGGGTGKTDTIDSSVASTYKDIVTLKISNATKTDPQKEYVEILASTKNEKPITISNWKIKGKEGLDVKLGTGAYLVFSGQTNTQEAIALKPGGKAIVITGKSPIGTSFRLNKCTGFFEQFQDFVPALPKYCPYPKDENPPSYLSNYCLDYIDDMSKCEMPTSYPVVMDTSCVNYLTQNVGYSACVNNHKNDSDFYSNEWRIFLGRSQEMWADKRETITLFDENNKIVDQVSY